ncbi:hypothetical protein J6590_023234 [Homalodisca vitripennis]|nr:hypothetical protein J6590_023234 [Homalodisca vitripennis]
MWDVVGNESFVSVHNISYFTNSYLKSDVVADLFLKSRDLFVCREPKIVADEKKRLRTNSLDRSDIRDI